MLKTILTAAAIITLAATAPSFAASKHSSKQASASVRAQCLAWLNSMDPHHDNDAAVRHPDKVAECIRRGGPNR